MKLEYVKVAHYTKDKSCPHNDALVCDMRKCWCCGWNPRVAQKRSEKILDKLAKEGAKAHG